MIEKLDKDKDLGFGEFTNTGPAHFSEIKAGKLGVLISVSSRGKVAASDSFDETDLDFKIQPWEISLRSGHMNSIGVTNSLL